MPSASGFLIVDKAVGLRSSYCVELIKRALGRGHKVGHGGTLDSTASGVLVLLIDKATRLSSAVMGMVKHYSAEVQLGAETDTCDASGAISARSDAASVSEHDIDRALINFLGWRSQVPPEVSAIHIDGRRAHEVYRKCGRADIPSRNIFVRSLRRIGHLNDALRITLDVVCSKGTYIRSLARDIGRHLGCFAHLASLRRLSVGPFGLDHAFKMTAGEEIDQDHVRDAIIPAEHIKLSLPSYRADDTCASRLMDGISVPIDSVSRSSLGSFPYSGEMAAVFADRGISICSIDVQDRRLMLSPEINLKND